MTRSRPIPLRPLTIAVTALGKGGIGEVAGFAAAFYRCGAGYVQAPTTP